MASQFPIQASPFFGRTQSLSDVRACLANPDCRLLTLTGTGGCGKTRLATQAAEASLTLFPHGVYFVGLQSLSAGELLVSTIAYALDISFYGATPPQQQLYERLHDKSLLLILCWITRRSSATSWHMRLSSR
jgi:hypothetical protein